MNNEDREEFTDKGDTFICVPALKNNYGASYIFMTLSDLWPHKCDARISHTPVTC